MFTSKGHATAQMVRHPPDHAAERERFVEDLLAIMSVAEKAGQLLLLPIPEAGGDSEGAPLRAEMLQGRVGGLLGSGAADQLAALQRLAVEETRLGIPLLMANVPGRGTSVTMPAPLALAATWSPHIVESAAQILAGEARAHGMNWLMGPQVVLTSDTETEELAESWGHFSTSGARPGRGHRARPAIRGQDGDGVLACLRTDAPGWIERRDPDILTDKLRLVAGVLRESPPASIALGLLAQTVHDRGETADGAPSIGGPASFDGIDLAEWVAIGRSAGQEAGETPYQMLAVDSIVKAVGDGRVGMRQLDDAVRKVLGAKYDLGLFRADLRDIAPATDWSADHARTVALDTARHAIVLLRNDPALLPLDIASGEILVVGHAATDRALPTGGAEGDAANLLDGFDALGLAHSFVPGLAVRADARPAGLLDADHMAIGMACNAARRVGTVIVTLGDCERVGEAEQTLLDSLHAVNPNIVLISLGSQPLDPDARGTKLPCVLHAGQLGTMSGHALAEVLTGEFAPRGRLPLPLTEKGQAGFTLGHGLGYSDFGLGETAVELSHDRIIVSATLYNVGKREGTETVQLYVRSPGQNGAQARRLADFQRVSLMAGETRSLLFEVGGNQLGHFRSDGSFVIEAGTYEIAVGLSDDRAHVSKITVSTTLARTMERALSSEPLPALFGRLRNAG